VVRTDPANRVDQTSTPEMLDAIPPVADGAFGRVRRPKCIRRDAAYGTLEIIAEVDAQGL
jgi:hypothetical protein